MKNERSEYLNARVDERSELLGEYPVAYIKKGG